MNKKIENSLNELLKEAKECFAIKTQDSIGNFNYYKGRLVGIGNVCKDLGYDEELKRVLEIAKEYPFS